MDEDVIIAEGRISLATLLENFKDAARKGVILRADTEVRRILFQIPMDLTREAVEMQLAVLRGELVMQAADLGVAECMSALLSLYQCRAQRSSYSANPVSACGDPYAGYEGGLGIGELDHEMYLREEIIAKRLRAFTRRASS